MIKHNPFKTPAVEKDGPAPFFPKTSTFTVWFQLSYAINFIKAVQRQILAK